jgi:large subunit ribosomal protein L18
MDTKVLRRQKLRYRIRKSIKGTADRPRLSVFRSNKDIYAQIIDDVNGVTLAAANSAKVATTGNKVDKSKAVGEAIAKAAIAKGITSVVFDRSGYLYHGRVLSLAEGAREGGLQF